MGLKPAGEAGEKAALKFLLEKGYRAVEANYRTRYGEIDLIMEKDGVLVFCEVKAKSGIAFTRPLERVDLKKQRKIIISAEQWLSEHPTDFQPRFDVVEVFFERGRAEIVHIENAFD